MTETMVMSERVDRYVRSELGAAETAAFEAELLESPGMQDALEVALGLQRVARLAGEPASAEVLPLRTQSVAVTRARPAGPLDVPSGWRSWALAASVVLAVTSTTLLWRAETQNGRLQARVDELGQPLVEVLTVPVDVMRSADPSAPDVRIRRPAAAAVLVLDVEVAARLAGLGTLELRLSGPDGTVLSSRQVTPTPHGRVEIALRTDAVPDGVFTLHIGAPDSGAEQVRRVELLPAH
jgi:hypothetical protein